MRKTSPAAGITGANECPGVAPLSLPGRMATSEGGWRREQDAVSEVVGAFVLIAIAMVAMGVILFLLFANPLPTRVPSFSGFIANESNIIYISHEGGDPIFRGDFRIYVDNVDETWNFTKSLPDVRTFSAGRVMNATLPKVAKRVVMIFNSSWGGGTVLLSANLVPTVPLTLPGWFSGDWPYRKKIIIDNTMAADYLSYFPVLIVLSDNNGLPKSQTGGNDILFTASDGTTQLPHEIEYFDHNGGVLYAWVRVPSLSPDTDTVIYMYYGNPNAPNQQQVSAVWNEGGLNYFKTVWHLKEGGTGTRYDSTITGNNLNPRNYDGNEAITGQIAGADRLEGTDDYLESASNIGITGNAIRTITFWVRLSNTNRCGMVGWGGPSLGGEFEAGVRNNGGGDNYFSWGYGAVDWDTGVTAQTGAWHYHAYVYDGSRIRWYIDGSQLGTGSSKNYATTDSHVYVGYENDPGMSSVTWMNGRIDEVRIATTNRQLSWILTEYRNQNSPGTYITLLPDEQTQESMS
jgi:hypothetical protein